MKSIYNFGIYCYKQLVALAGIRNVKARKLTQGQKGIFDYLSRHADPQGGYLWIHASSLGEFEQGRPLIEAIKKAQPDTKILLTFFSPSGYEVRKDYSGADLICYLPFDLPGNVRRFLDLTKPTKAIFIKYEFWANYLNELKRRNIPTYIVSAIFRPKQIFFRSYGGYFRRILKNFTHLYIQDERSRQLLASIGIDNVSIVGDTRFDRVGDIHGQRITSCRSLRTRKKDTYCRQLVAQRRGVHYSIFQSQRQYQTHSGPTRNTRISFAIDREITETPGYTLHTSHNRHRTVV